MCIVPVFGELFVNVALGIEIAICRSGCCFLTHFTPKLSTTSVNHIGLVLCVKRLGV